MMQNNWNLASTLHTLLTEHFDELLIRARCKLRGLLARGMETKLQKSGTRKFLGDSDHSPKIIKSQGMKLLPFFVACLSKLSRNKN